MKIKEGFEKYGLLNLQSLDKSIMCDIKYATSDNFTKSILYNEDPGAYCEPALALAVSEANKTLKQISGEEMTLLIYDAARPLSTQNHMFSIVKDTPFERYVANPNTGNIGGFHNYGMAIDLTIFDKKNNTTLNMGSEFDSFSEISHVGNERQLIDEGKLTIEHWRNRALLYYIMAKHGMLPHPFEWWHYQLDYSEKSKRINKLLNF